MISDGRSRQFEAVRVGWNWFLANLPSFHNYPAGRAQYSLDGVKCHFVISRHAVMGESLSATCLAPFLSQTFLSYWFASWATSFSSSSPVTLCHSVGYLDAHPRSDWWSGSAVCYYCFHLQWPSYPLHFPLYSMKGAISSTSSPDPCTYCKCRAGTKRTDRSAARTIGSSSGTPYGDGRRWGPCTKLRGSDAEWSTHRR